MRTIFIKVICNLEVSSIKVGKAVPTFSTFWPVRSGISE